jgi:hopanoid-associated phosphorylase
LTAQGAGLGAPRVAVVVGLKAEGRVANVGPHLTIIGGGSVRHVEAGLALAQNRADAEGRPLQAILSFGLAGGLAENLRPGDLVVAKAIVAADATFRCHDGWVANLARLLPQAHLGDMAGVDAAVGSPKAKSALHTHCGALAVDMESHGAARFAQDNGLPFAALRAIADPRSRALPQAALVGMKNDGSPDILAVLAALARQPAQLPGLIQTAFDAKAGMTALLGARRQLGASFGFAGLL